MGLGATILHGVVFLYLQLEEFKAASFTIADGIYGSSFYMLVGVHGMHVFAGVRALGVMLVRLLLQHFSTERHLGLRLSIWYWHFVDVVWVALWLIVYIWKS